MELKDLDVNKLLNEGVPENGDPDRDSIELKEYHRVLWSSRKIGSKPFTLVNGSGNRLIYKDDNLEIVLTPDSITNSFYGHKRRRPIIDKYCEEDISIRDILNAYFHSDYSIGTSIIYPTIINGVPIEKTFNIKRGISPYIKDRMDYTLECIKRYYDKSNEFNPLLEDIEKNKLFFDLFIDFKGYVDFFFLNDLVDKDYNVISFTGIIDFNNPYPKDRNEYKRYLINMMKFYNDRNNRIDGWIKDGLSGF